MYIILIKLWQLYINTLITHFVYSGVLSFRPSTILKYIITYILVNNSNVGLLCTNVPKSQNIALQSIFNVDLYIMNIQFCFSILLYLTCSKWDVHYTICFSTLIGTSDMQGSVFCRPDRPEPTRDLLTRHTRQNRKLSFEKQLYKNMFALWSSRVLKTRVGRLPTRPRPQPTRPDPTCDPALQITGRDYGRVWFRWVTVRLCARLDICGNGFLHANPDSVDHSYYCYHRVNRGTRLEFRYPAEILGINVFLTHY